jgi:hypothetical protein
VVSKKAFRLPRKGDARVEAQASASGDRKAPRPHLRLVRSRVESRAAWARAPAVMGSKHRRRCTQRQEVLVVGSAWASAQPCACSSGPTRPAGTGFDLCSPPAGLEGRPQYRREPAARGVTDRSWACSGFASICRSRRAALDLEGSLVVAAARGSEGSSSCRSDPARTKGAAGGRAQKARAPGRSRSRRRKALRTRTSSGPFTRARRGKRARNPNSTVPAARRAVELGLQSVRTSAFASTAGRERWP